MNNPIFSHQISRKEFAIELLKLGSICIAFDLNNLNEIWGFYLYSNQKKLYVWKEYGKTIYDGLLEKADDSLFEFGSEFLKINYPEDCNITPLTKGRFYLLPGKVLCKILLQK